MQLFGALVATPDTVMPSSPRYTLQVAVRGHVREHPGHRGDGAQLHDPRRVLLAEVPDPAGGVHHEGDHHPHREAAGRGQAEVRAQRLQPRAEAEEEGGETRGPTTLMYNNKNLPRYLLKMKLYYLSIF